MTSEIYLLDKKVDEIMKKLRKKPKTFNILTTLRKLLQIISIVPELNMQDTTLLFNIEFDFIAVIVQFFKAGKLLLSMMMS